MVLGVGGQYHTFEDAVYIGGKYYFVDLSDGNLYCFCGKSKEAELKARLSDNNLSRSFSSLVSYKSFLFLFPFNARDVVVYDTITNKTNHIPINLPKEYSAENGLFHGACVYKSIAFVLGSSVPLIMIFDLEKKEIRQYCLFREKLYDYFNESVDHYCFCKGVIIQDHLYAPFCQGNAVVKLNINTFESEVVTIGHLNDGFSSICYYGDRFWLTSRNKCKIYCTSMSLFFIKEYTISEELDKCCFIDFMHMDDGLVVLGYMNDKSYRYSKDLDVFCEIDGFNFGKAKSVIHFSSESMIVSALTGIFVLAKGTYRKILRIKKHGLEGNTTPVYENSIDNLNSLITYINNAEFRIRKFPTEE